MSVDLSFQEPLRQRVDERATRRELGATSETRPESGALDQRRRAHRIAHRARL